LYFALLAKQTLFCCFASQFRFDEISFRRNISLQREPY
jgi:hypothetical protein